MLLAVGIAMFPLAIAARRVGVTLRFDRLVERVGTAYDGYRSE
jgi:hypothetical protein